MKVCFNKTESKTHAKCMSNLFHGDSSLQLLGNAASVTEIRNGSAQFRARCCEDLSGHSNTISEEETVVTCFCDTGIRTMNSLPFPGPGLKASTVP